MVWLVVVFSRPTLKPLRTYSYRSALSKYLIHTFKCASKKRGPVPSASCGSISTGHQTGQTHPFTAIKISQTSCLASCGPSTNKLENRWWPKVTLHICISYGSCSWPLICARHGPQERLEMLRAVSPIKVMMVFNQRRPSRSWECSHSKKRLSLCEHLGGNCQFLPRCPRLRAWKGIFSLIF